jgi:glycosyltransferase involved in cell wall biosynthesis
MSIKAFLLKKIKIVSTVLDVCHVDFPNFKEVSGSRFYYREFLNFKILPKSLFIITESKDLKNKISHLYKLNRNKIIPIPNIPSYLMTRKNDLSKFLKEEYIAKVEKNYLKNKYNINFDYYFYPAQFWAHKNHIIILELLKKISKKKKINFIFSGQDKGCLKYIQNKILEYSLEKNIKILGYVSSEDILLLYKYANALVMPTYFGPTNIPPVEAWSLNVPVIYSSLLINHGKNAALYFHPNSINELENAIIRLETFNVREKLIVNGRNRLKNIIRENSLAQKLFCNKINAEISLIL